MVAMILLFFVLNTCMFLQVERIFGRFLRHNSETTDFDIQRARVGTARLRLT